MKAASFAVLALTTTLAHAQKVEFPSIVTEKTLYAKNDLRGKKAPKFEVEKWLTGDAPALKGKVIVIDFWATWCPPCRELIPEMNEWAKKFSKDIVFIGVSDEKEETVRGFMEKTKFEYHLALDSQKKMSKALGIEGIPHVIVISPDGIVRWQGFPLDDKDKLTADILDQIVKAGKSK
ncbi:MAG: TlpA family protein disulfide reductase [Armatimonadetes bacterium]|nr:TlpA family protein disulfide reductase [Armatimonadota bacterium]